MEIGPPWHPPFSAMHRVDAIWSSEKDRRGDSLVNGRIYGLAEFRSDFLLIRPSEYRYALALRRDPDLKGSGLDIRPVGVTGILHCADGLVLGRRGPGVADDGGLWEPAPAGGLSLDDPRAQILEELEEELGIPGSAIISVEALGLVEDMETGVFDIIFRLQTMATERDILYAFAARGSDEYSELAIIRPSQVPEFLNAHGDCLLPAVRPMLHLAGIMPAVL